VVVLVISMGLNVMLLYPNWQVLVANFFGPANLVQGISVSILGQMGEIKLTQRI
jgi:hypothetical protein